MSQEAAGARRVSVVRPTIRAKLLKRLQQGWPGPGVSGSKVDGLRASATGLRLLRGK